MSLFLSVMIGLLGHGLEEPIRRWYDGDEDAVKLAQYTAGGILILIAFGIVSFGLLPRRQWMIAMLSACGAEIGVGTGVVMAHIWDGVK